MHVTSLYAIVGWVKDEFGEYKIAYLTAGVGLCLISMAFLLDYALKRSRDINDDNIPPAMSTIESCSDDCDKRSCDINMTNCSGPVSKSRK